MSRNPFVALGAFFILSLLSGCGHHGGGGGGNSNPPPVFPGSLQVDATTFIGVPASEVGIVLPHQPIYVTLLDTDEVGVEATMTFTDPSGAKTVVPMASADGQLFVPYVGGNWMVKAVPVVGNFSPLEESFMVLPWEYTLWGAEKSLLPGQSQNWEIRDLNNVPTVSEFGQEQSYIQVYNLLGNGVPDLLFPHFIPSGTTSENFAVSNDPGQYILIGVRPQWNGGVLEQHATPLTHVRVLDPNGDVGLEFAGYVHAPSEFVPFTVQVAPTWMTPTSVFIQFDHLSQPFEEPFKDEVPTLTQPYNGWAALLASENPGGLWRVKVTAIWPALSKDAYYFLWIQ